jgi:hypothetical protein
MRLTDHVTLNFNNKIYTATVFLAIEKAFDNIWALWLAIQVIQIGIFDMTPETRGREARVDVYFWATKFSRNEHACNNRRTVVSMQRRDNISIKI